MINKQTFIFGLLFMFSISFCLAATTFEETSLGEISLPWLDHSIPIEEAIVFVAVFVMLFAIILEISNLLAFSESLVTRVIFSFVFSLFLSMTSPFYQVIMTLKDKDTLTNWILGLTFWNWMVFIISLVLVAFIIILLRKLIAQWKIDSQKEEEEIEKIQEQSRKKLQAIKYKYSTL